VPRRSRTGQVVALATLLVIASGCPGPVDASPVAVAVADETVTATATSWAAAATLPGGTPTGGPLTLVWTSDAGQASTVLDVVNVGRATLGSQRLVVRSLTAAGASGTDPVELSACVGADWDTASGTCAGTVVALGSDRDSPLTMTLTLAPGVRVSVRATTRPRTAAQTTTTVSVVVDRSDVRPPSVRSG
jgi:hypothetical protein